MKKYLLMTFAVALILCACAQSSNMQEAPEKELKVIEIDSPPIRSIEPPFEFTERNFPRIDGSTATIPIIEAVQSVLLQKPREEISVNVSKTSGAYIALFKGTADILFVYDGGDETRAQVGADKNFETVPIGLDALIFIVNRDNPVENLTTEQVQKIFTGEYTNWSQVGGANEPIRAYQRGATSGSEVLKEKLVMQGLPAGNTASIQSISEMGGLIDVVANYAGGPNGIGYSVFYYVTEMRENDYIKILSIDGVMPSYETIQSGQYPFVSEFYSVIRCDEPEDSPARILHNWMQTPEAQNLLKSENYVALYDDPAAETPYVAGEFSNYPPGEEPVYFEGVDFYTFAPREDYGRIYLYRAIGHNYEITYYGICTENGEIVTFPVYTDAIMLEDSEGNRAYLCYRTDMEQSMQTIPQHYPSGYYENKEILTPALLIATDGSWVLEFDAVAFPSGLERYDLIYGTIDMLAVKSGEYWGAVNLKGEMVVPFEKSNYDEIYPSYPEELKYAYCISANIYARGDGENWNDSETYSIYDGNMNVIASGLLGQPTGVKDFILTYDWQAKTVRTYTLAGELIAARVMEQGFYGDERIRDGLVYLISGAGTQIYDRELNLLCEVNIGDDEPPSVVYFDESVTIRGSIYKADYTARLYRTYLLDGTHLVTWYFPDLNENSAWYG